MEPGQDSPNARIHRRCCARHSVRSARAARVAGQAACPIYFWIVSPRFSELGAAIFHAQAHVPAQPSSPLEDARVSQQNEDQERTSSVGAPARQGTQASLGEAGIPRIASPAHAVWRVSP